MATSPIFGFLIIGGALLFLAVAYYVLYVRKSSEAIDQPQIQNGTVKIQKRPPSTLAYILVTIFVCGVIWFCFFSGSISGLGSRVTMDEFNQIQSGMSYQQTVNIIGFDGTEMSRSELFGIVTVMYSWSNSNGSNMNAMFQNDQLISKAQLGLP